MKTSIISVQTLEWTDRHTNNPVTLYAVNYYGKSSSTKCMTRHYDQNDRKNGRIPATVLRFLETHVPSFCDTRVDFFTPAKAGYYIRTEADTI